MSNEPTTAPLVKVLRGDTTDFYGYQFKTNGTPDDLSEWTWAATWRPKADSPDEEALELTVDDSESNIGKVYVTGSAEVTAQMTGPGVWDLQRTHPTQGVKTPVSGSTALIKDVTRG